MVQSTSGILLHAIKHSDSSAVLQIYTKEFGRKAYFLRGMSKKKNSPRSILHPLAILELQATERESKSLQQIREVNLKFATPNLISNPIKASVILFLAELLHKSIEDNYQNDVLFDFLENALRLLDATENSYNFHIWFLLELSKHFGFYPMLSAGSKNALQYFNLETGTFQSSLESVCLNSEISSMLKSFLGMNFDELSTLKMASAERSSILHGLVDYYIQHVPNLKRLESLDVLETVFEF